MFYKSPLILVENNIHARHCHEYLIFGHSLSNDNSILFFVGHSIECPIKILGIQYLMNDTCQYQKVVIRTSRPRTSSNILFYTFPQRLISLASRPVEWRKRGEISGVQTSRGPGPCDKTNNAKQIYYKINVDTSIATYSGLHFYYNINLLLVHSC